MNDQQDDDAAMLQKKAMEDLQKQEVMEAMKKLSADDVKNAGL